MRHTIRLLLVSLLLAGFAWAAPAWHLFAPANDRFSCQMPEGKLQDSKDANGHQWVLLERGKYVLQVGYANEKGSPAQMDTYIKQYTTNAKITETGRKAIEVNGLKGTEVTGVMSPTPGAKISARLRIFLTKDRIYFVAALLPSPAANGIADQFFKSFKTK
ncbi:hypothetical protein JST97_00110 [bacterium]|nr:hypothetical protein [bacterium]